MNLEEFIRESLTQIFRGVRAAAGEAEESEAYVGPAPLRADRPVSHVDGRPLTDVQFDVAITVTESASGKGGIRVLGIGLGLEAGTENLNSTVSHIRFTVSVALPRGGKEIKGRRATMIR